MSLPDDAPPLSEAEQAWPYASWPLEVGRLLELGEGVRMGLLAVLDDGSARVQVYEAADPAAAETVTLTLGYPVQCKGRSIRLLSVDRTGPRSLIHATVG